MQKINDQKKERISEEFEKIKKGGNKKKEPSDQKNESLSEEIVQETITNDVELFHNENKEGYVRIKIIDHYEIYKITSKAFKDYIAYIFWEKHRKSINSEALNCAIRTLEGMAKFNGCEYKLHIRTAWYDNALWYDLGDWRAVRIDENGWEVINDPPILFKKYSHQKVQVEPVKGGDLNEILKFVNLEKKYHLLLLTYLVVVLIPNIPRAVIIVHGEQGSSKSTFLRIIKSLIDPSILKEMSCPKNEIELIQILSHHFAAFFDNLSFLPEGISDSFSKACTGSGFSKRQLYTDDEDVLYYFIRAIGINGINLVATKPDLLERALIFELPSIKKESRIQEKILWFNFNKKKPEILGAMFNTISLTMKIEKENEIEVKGSPRLADYAYWCCACAKALGYSPGEFIKKYEKNIELQNSEAIESSPIAQAIIEFMQEKRDWKGTSNELLRVLEEKDSELDAGWTKSKIWPKTPSWVWKRIKEVKTNLTAIDIKVVYNDKDRPRTITLKNERIEKSTDGTDFVDVEQAFNDDGHLANGQ